MAIGVTVVELSTGVGTSISTSSISPAANALLLVQTVTYTSAVNVLSMSGNGLTYVPIYDNANYSDVRVVSLFRALGASPSAGVITITNTIFSNTEWAILHFTGVDTSGTNGSGAIVQSVRNAAYGASGVTATLSTFSGAGNATYGGGTTSGDTAVVTAGSGFTLSQYSDGLNRLFAEYQLANDTTVDVTGPSANYEMQAVEIKAAGGGGGVTQARLDGGSMRGVERGVQRGHARIVTTNWKRHGSGLFVPATAH